MTRRGCSAPSSQRASRPAAWRRSSIPVPMGQTASPSASRPCRWKGRTAPTPLSGVWSSSPIPPLDQEAVQQLLSVLGGYAVGQVTGADAAALGLGEPSVTVTVTDDTGKPHPDLCRRHRRLLPDRGRGQLGLSGGCDALSAFCPGGRPDVKDKAYFCKSWTHRRCAPGFFALF